MVSTALTKRTPCPLWKCRPGIRQRFPSTLSRRYPAFLEHGLPVSRSDGTPLTALPACRSAGVLDDHTLGPNSRLTSKTTGVFGSGQAWVTASSSSAQRKRALLWNAYTLGIREVSAPKQMVPCTLTHASFTHSNTIRSPGWCTRQPLDSRTETTILIGAGRSSSPRVSINVPFSHPVFRETSEVYTASA